MCPYAVFLYSCGSGPCWVEIMHGERQEGPDVDFDTRRRGLSFARRECVRLGLDSFNECSVHRISKGGQTA